MTSGELDTAAGSACLREGEQTLLGAVLSVSSDLSLPDVLRRIVQAARQLVHARYAALGVLDDHGGLSDFLTEGLSDDQVAAIGQLPSGQGLLGELIRHPEPIRLDDLAQHPASAGFPREHPPMGAFLGVPIRVRDQVYGNLYLTSPVHGRSFSRADEDIVVALAAAAGIAVDNARNFEHSHHREAWLAWLAELSSAVQQGCSGQQALELLCAQARSLSRAGAVAIQLEDGAAAYDAATADHGLVDRTRRLTRPQPEAGSDRPLPRADKHLLVVGVGVGPHALGTMVATRRTSAPAFTPAEHEMFRQLAGQAGTALRLAHAQDEQARSRVFHDRERIARDLHDLVIQRLFATGLSLQATQNRLHDPADRERVEQAIDNLDATIRDIRRSIWALRTHHPQATDVRTVLEQAVEQAQVGGGPRIELRLDGPLGSAVPAELVDEVRAVVTEGLSNVRRHAHARRARVTAATDGSSLRVDIDDDGVGIAAGSSRSGLDNLAARAVRWGGTLRVSSPTKGGTQLRWDVPLSATPGTQAVG